MLVKYSKQLRIFALVFTAGLCLAACDKAQVDASNKPDSAAQTTVASSATKSTHPIADCAKAMTIINTCAYENTCDENITTFLPSEPRSHYNLLSQTSWFNTDAFTKYCINACLAKNANVDASAFKLEVCGYAE